MLRSHLGLGFWCRSDGGGCDGRRSNNQIREGVELAIWSVRNSLKRKQMTQRSLLLQVLHDLVRSTSVLSRLRERVVSARSYSQYGEDKVLRSLLPEAFGHYLDVGAGDPVRFSNTYLFYCEGWRGTLIEPIPSLAEKARATRKRDVVINAAVGLSESSATKLKFYQFVTTELSTLDAQRARDLVSDGHELMDEISVDAIALSTITPEIGPRDPFLLSVDVEGLDFDVLKSIDWARFTPRVVCVEDPERLKGSTQISNLMDENGYELVSQNNASSIYLHGVMVN